MRRLFLTMRRQLDETLSRLSSSARAFGRRVTARVDPPEHEQAIIRLAFALGVFIYFLWTAARDSHVDTREGPVLAATVIYLLLSIAIQARVLITGGVSDIRRYAGMVLDNAGITYFMATMGEDGAVMFGLYLFITFGNGLPLRTHVPTHLPGDVVCGIRGSHVFRRPLVKQPHDRRTPACSRSPSFRFT